MPSAHLLKMRYWGVVILSLSLFKPTPVAATAIQSCIQGSSCVVGEFVYADNATPLATASCELTSFTPSGNPYLTAVPLTGTVDGWYGHTFTPTVSDPVGMYPTRICCNTTENNICIDKSFALSAVAPTATPGLTASDISNAIWDATSSSHTTAGSLGQQLGQLQNNTISPTDIWSYANRSLSSFGSLVSDLVGGVWNASQSAHTTTGTMGQQLNTLQNNPITPSDIWGYTNRSLSSFGSLLSDIISGVWSNSTRTVTSVNNVDTIVNGVWDATPSAHNNPDSFGQKVGTNPSLSASDVWSYANRSITDVNNITSGVWNYSDRSITSATNIVNEVWDYQNRSLNSYSNLVTSIWSNPKAGSISTSSADLTEITREVKASRELLEQLVNAPTVSTYLGEDPTPKLQSKLNTTKDYVSQIATNLELASTKVGLVTLKWDQLTDSDRNQQLQQTVASLGTDESKDPKSIIGQLNWIALAWNKPLTRDLHQSMVSLRDDLSAFLTTLQAAPPNDDQLAYLNGLFARFTSIKVEVGDISQTENDATLFGLVKTLNNVVTNLDVQEQAVTAAVSDWDKTPTTVRPKIVSAIAESMGKLNQIPALNTLLSPITPSKEFLGNLHALINLNRTVLASSNGESVAGTFISTDPIRFRTLLHNPSVKINQTAKVDYLLPSELTLDQITKTPPEYSIVYDPSSKALRVTAEVDLEPGESKLIDLTTNDIWEIRSEEIDSLRKQAVELVKPLENSNLYTEATSIKSSIDVALDTVVSLKEKATTPSGKIQAFHQSQILITEVKHQLEALHNLINQSQSTTSLMGFIGGAQAIAVWGIIVIFIAGFVFLTLYMRALYQNTLMQPATSTGLTLPLTGPATLPTPKTAPSFSLPFEMPKLNFLTDKTFNVSLTILASLLLTTMVAQHLPKVPSQNSKSPAIVTVSPLPLSQLEPLASPSASPAASPAASPSANLLITPANAAASINIRRDPNPGSPKLDQITAIEKAVEIEVVGDWYHVRLIDHDPIITGWVFKDYVSPINDEK